MVMGWIRDQGSWKLQEYLINVKKMKAAVQRVVISLECRGF